jgi:hypothetical protein
MLSLVPQFHDLVGSAANRNVAQLREMGVEPTGRSVRVAVHVEPSPTPGRWLLATTLVDMLLRLDPLVSEVMVSAPGMDEDALIGELAARLPLAVGRQPGASADYAVSVGTHAAGANLMVDGAGWVAAIGQPAKAEDDGNPVGPLAAAALGAAEVFKWTFAATYPGPAAVLEMTPWRGQFSLFSYDVDGASPPLPDFRIATTLIGAGGVGAGMIRTVAALGPRVSGTLELVDGDVLTTDSLNRVSYATLAGALASASKVREAEAYLRLHCPNLTVTAYPETFDTYKARTPRRIDRTYDVVVTGLDDDQTRWDVQRDLPRILIDGATGSDMVARVERVEYGRYGCLGCSRRRPATRSVGPVACDRPPDPHAPSLSFVSSFPGVLAAGEVLKEASGLASLRGHFDHVFRYGPNPDLVGMPAIRADCQVGCSRPGKLNQYERKYPGELLG